MSKRRIHLPGGGPTDHDRMVAAAMEAAQPKGPGVVPMADVGIHEWGPMPPVEIQGEHYHRLYAIQVGPGEDDRIYAKAAMERTGNGTLVVKGGFVLTRQIIEVPIQDTGTTVTMDIQLADSALVLALGPGQWRSIAWAPVIPWMHLTPDKLDGFVEFVKGWLMAGGEDEVEKRIRMAQDPRGPVTLVELFLADQESDQDASTDSPPEEESPSEDDTSID